MLDGGICLVGDKMGRYQWSGVDDANGHEVVEETCGKHFMCERLDF